MDLIAMLTEPARRAGLEARSLAALVRAGVIGVETPLTLASVVQALVGYGPLGGAPRVAALRHGDLPAIADERGEITFAEFDEQINRLANALTDRGLQPGAGIGILCRNHRAPLIAAFAASRNGMNAIWLNTGFSARQAREVSGREGVSILIHDEDFAEIVAEIEPEHGKVVALGDGDELDALIASGEPKLPPSPKKPGRL